MASIAALLHVDAVALDVDVPDWEAAIRRAGGLLEGVGVAEPAYTQSMVDSVHKNGPYIVIAPGFAFAHARPSEAVKRTGMAWMRLSTPVEFGHRSNDPVRLVVALAATDSTAHQSAMGELARLLADPQKKSALDGAANAQELLALLNGGHGNGDAAASSTAGAAARRSTGRGSTRNHILTVCGNGLGTSLFLKNTVEKVLDRWGWGSYVSVEATDTVSAKGKAKEADLIITSGEIGRALGDLGVPMQIIEDFTSAKEVDAALRASYDI